MLTVRQSGTNRCYSAPVGFSARSCRLTHGCIGELSIEVDKGGVVVGMTRLYFVQSRRLLPSRLNQMEQLYQAIRGLAGELKSAIAQDQQTAAVRLADSIHDRLLIYKRTSSREVRVFHSHNTSPAQCYAATGLFICKAQVQQAFRFL